MTVEPLLKPKSLFEKSGEHLKSDSKEKKKEKQAIFLPNISGPQTFLTEPIETTKFFNKTISRSKESKVSLSKFQLTKDSKMLQTLQSSLQKRNFASTSILPKLKQSIADQNNQALASLENQVKSFQKEYNQIRNKKY